MSTIWLLRLLVSCLKALWNLIQIRIFVIKMNRFVYAA